MLAAAGRRVETQNYIDNTGVQVADVVAGFHRLERKTPADVARLIADPTVRFDYLCWDLYARVSAHYQGNPEALAWRQEALHAIEAGQGEMAEMAHLVADAIVNCHLRTMLRLGVEYDVLPRESEILHLHFWAAAFELLKQRQAIYFEREGKNAGCWVMPASAFSFALRDLELAVSDRFALAAHAPGTDRSEAVLFPGCQLAASDPEPLERVYAHLREQAGMDERRHLARAMHDGIAQVWRPGDVVNAADYPQAFIDDLWLQLSSAQQTRSRPTTWHRCRYSRRSMPWWRCGCAVVTWKRGRHRHCCSRRSSVECHDRTEGMGRPGGW